jgi:GNAT superfamily N-acetyltransferase
MNQFPADSQIIEVQADSTEFEQVLKLWRGNSATLGLMPEGGFRDHAQNGWLIAVCAPNGVQGYVMYRRGRERAAVVHLCIAPEQRGKGIAKLLIQAVSKRTQNCAGIALKCRRDFDANKVWPKLGFVPLNDIPGRSKSSALLTCWWLDHGHENLLSVPKTTTALRAVIDMNVFVHLREQTNPESLALQADWLVGLVELCLTDEALIEIGRQEEDEARIASRTYAQTFPILVAKPAEIESAADKLRTILRDDGNASVQSDFKQVAKTIANGISVFVTHDQGILDHTDAIYDEFGLRIIRPGELITELDALRREEEYRPARLAGTQLSIRRDCGPDLSAVVDAFQNIDAGETKSALSRHISAMLAKPEEHDIQVVRSADDRLLGCIAYQFVSADEMRIPLLRVSRNPQAPTLIRHLLFETIKRSVAMGRVLTRITDPNLQKEASDAVWRDFWKSGNGDWVKASPSGIGTAESLGMELRRIAIANSYPESDLNPLLEKINDQASLSDPVKFLSIEKMFWPSKVVNGQMPCYIMPIRPEWAKHLFDDVLATADLFGADETVALNREIVYYRAAQPGLPTAPGRVLWYVSKAVGEIRATSQVVEVSLGTAKELYRRNRRFGVYRWPDILQLAKGDAQKEIMAVTLTNTEVFREPISFKGATETLRKFGVRTNFMSPVKIPTEAYFELYLAALKKNG